MKTPSSIHISYAAPRDVLQGRRKDISDDMIEPLDITTREELHRWYEENHDTAAEMVIPCSRAKTVKPGIIRYLNAVEEALCFGWIDSFTKSEDVIFYQRFSPRRKS